MQARNVAQSITTKICVLKFRSTGRKRKIVNVAFYVLPRFVFFRTNEFPKVTDYI
jgi:hypothetical protein